MLCDLSKRRARELPAMGAPTCAVFSPRGDRLLIGYQQNMARLWNPATKLPLFGPLTHATAVVRVAWSHDGRMVATGASNGRARLWDAATGTALTPMLAHAFN